jgi:predicted signal transduction protein with EAL and GGDEF domain
MRVITPEGEHAQLMALNLGPSHPATHGTLRILAALDGETIAAGVGEMGYLHRGFEKMIEQGTYQMVLPFTDRLNYCSAMMNNIGFCKAAERMFGVEVPERCITIRVILLELSRIIDHLVCNAANLVDLGALTNFWYFFNRREQVYTIWAKLCGARLTNTVTRIGGMYRDIYPGFESDVLKAVAGRLVESVRASDTVARLAGDEFMVILEGLQAPEDAASVAAKIVEGIGAPIVTRAGPCAVGASIGVATCSHGCLDPEGLVKRADAAAYAAKDAGRGRYRMAVPEAGSSRAIIRA